MSSISGPARGTFERFIEGANAQYREAGLAEHQIKLDRNGQVQLPPASRTRFKAPSTSGSAAPAQASASAANVQRSGAAPKVSDLQKSGANGFALSWQPVAGATKYGIWQDGALIGHVTDPRFAGTVSNGSGGSIQVDAVAANGTRTQLTKALTVSMGPSGLAFDA